MKVWITALFYLICFLILATAIYRLGLLVPPQPGDSNYTSYRICVGIMAIVTSGMSVGFSMILDWVWDKKNDGDDKRNK